MTDRLTAIRRIRANHEAKMGEKPSRVLMAASDLEGIRLQLAPTLNHAKRSDWPSTVDGLQIVLDDSLADGQFLVA